MQQGLSTRKRCLGKQLSCECPSFLPLSPSCCCGAQRHTVWNIPLANLDHLPWLCPLPTSRAPACSLAGGDGTPRCCASSAEPDHRCAPSTASATNTKHSTIRAAAKNLDPTPARPSAEQFVLLKCCTYLLTPKSAFMQAGTGRLC